MNKKNYIWLLGENLGNTHNNNSYYFWKKALEHKDEIQKYLILTKNKENIKFLKTLNKYEKKYIVWKNSIKHFRLYFNADMYFVTLSYKDIIPEKYFVFNFNFKMKKPVIYLQHGTLGIKKIGYTYNSYNNNLFRFAYYNKKIKSDLIEKNKFKDYQLYYGEYHPRYMELVKRAELYASQKDKQKQILWFITWREYFEEDLLHTKVFNRKLKNVIYNIKLREYLKNTNTKLNIVLHQFFNTDELKKIIEELKNEKIFFSFQTNIDVMDEIAKSDLLITDYSSVGFDFSLLKKPVILFQPDLEVYLGKRNIYCEKEELIKNSISDEDELIDTIINNKYGLNEFYISRLPENIDYEYIKKGDHIEKMYEYFSNLQFNKITFLGYNFFGVGGTVSATMSLAEALLEKDYLVELISLKKTNRAGIFPAGLPVNTLYSEKSRKDKILSKLVIRKNHLKKLKYDPNINYIKPISGYRFNKLLKNIKSKTIVSTRESMHIALNEAYSKNIKNKVYFYHCDAKAVDEIFPGLMEKIKEKQLEKVVFVTEKNKEAYMDIFNYTQYENSLVLGNSIQSANTSQIGEINIVERINKEQNEIVNINEGLKTNYTGVYLLRINKERKNDIENLISFGKYLRDNNIKDIKINVYGKGDYVDEFIDLIIDEKLEDIICYMGYTNNVKKVLQQSDCLVDFSLINSFGMTYIEAILNGKMVYCMKNTGSLEVLKDVPDSYVESYEEIVQKIYNLPNISVSKLINNYNLIYNKYSREVLGNKFINFINDKD